MRRAIGGRITTLAAIIAAFGLGGLLRQPPGAGASAPKDEHRIEEQSPPPPMELFGTMGKEGKLVPGEETVLFERGGSGTLTHMWFGGAWAGWGDTRIRVYVDGEERAGIDMALSLGHGVGWGDDAAPWGTARLGKTGRPSGVYNTYQIPFGERVRVTA